MLVEAYEVIKTSGGTEAVNEATRFPIFDPKYVRAFEKELDFMAEDQLHHFGSIISSDTTTYSASLGLHAKRRVVRDNAEEEASFSSLMGLSALSAGISATPTAGASGAPPRNDRKKRKKGKKAGIPNVRTNAVQWNKYANDWLPKHLKVNAAKWNQCSNCRKVACWPCRIRTLAANISDACKFAENNGFPYAKTRSVALGNWKFGVPLPTFAFPNLSRCVLAFVHLRLVRVCALLTCVAATVAEQAG